MESSLVGDIITTPEESIIKYEQSILLWKEYVQQKAYLCHFWAEIAVYQ